MTSSFPFFFKGFTARTMALIVSLMLAIGVTSAQAQNSVALGGVTVSTNTTPPPTTTPLPAPVGLTVTGWNTSSIIGQGYTLGGDGKGTTSTLADGIFNLKVDANLSTNSQGGICEIDCDKTLTTIKLYGEQISGARSVNQGYGTSTVPVASIAGTSGNFKSSALIMWSYTPPPAATPAP